MWRGAAVCGGQQGHEHRPSDRIVKILTRGCSQLPGKYLAGEIAVQLHDLQVSAGWAVRVTAAQASGAGSPQVSQDLLGGIVRNLFQAGLSLQAALDAAHEADRQYIMQALRYLDQTIRDIRDQVFVTGWWQSPPPSEPPDGVQ